MDPAIRTRLEDVKEDLLGMKLRVAGQILSYDAYTGMALLRDRDVVVIMDVSLCVGRSSTVWVREHLCAVTAIGYLERLSTALTVPVLPRHFPCASMDGSLVLRAILVAARPDLELGLWNASVDNNARKRGVRGNCI
ncbi:hypothetical protein B0H10DRAFT_613158 [Mycena sp. CBHHK59/15]|nr:hypothetical protein B0H10DRAFT_613158 [Mycena sp. CBHHK59/15]